MINISNKNIIIYSILLIILLFITKNTNNFSYVFISTCLIVIYIYYNQQKYILNKELNIESNINKLKELNIKNTLIISKDNYLIELLYNSRFIYFKDSNTFNLLINYIEDFLITFETLRQNINNIFLKSNDLIKPIVLNKLQKSILINDIRDQFERIMNHIETFIHIIPDDIRYLNAYYKFSQLIRLHLTKYYNKILYDNNIDDHTSIYQLIRSSENKYGFIDW